MSVVCWLSLCLYLFNVTGADVLSCRPLSLSLHCTFQNTEKRHKNPVTFFKIKKSIITTSLYFFHEHLFSMEMLT